MRTAAHQLHASALEALAQAAAPLGWSFDPNGPAFVTRDGRIELTLHVVSFLDGPRARALGPAPPGGLVVADRVLEAARTTLRDASWDWFDRRGHLHLDRPGLFVDASLPPAQRARVGKPAPVLDGVVAAELAYLLLRSPERVIPASELKNSTGASRSSVYGTLKALRREGLLTADGRPVTPDLFWALADVWHTEPRRVEHIPQPVERPSVFVPDDLTSSGACLGGNRAALLHHAPLVASLDAPPLILVADEGAFASMNAAKDGQAGCIAVVPFRAALAQRYWPADSPWPVAPLLTVALELARDRARGIEVLEAWDAPGRVW